MDYTKLSLDQLQKAMKNGEITSKAFVIAFMKKIAEIDSCKVGKDGIPTGTLLMARRYDEGTLIKTAYVLEQILDLDISPNLTGSFND